MKRIKLVSLIMCFVLLFTACGSKNALDKETATSLAEKHTAMIVKGDYAAVVADCTETVAKQIDRAAMEQAWNTVAGMAGDYIMVYSTSFTEKDGLATVATTLEYENTGLMISLTYDADGKIRGLWFNTAAVKYEITDNEILTEQEIVIGEHRLKGVLTLPDSVENYPVAVLVQGSGSSDFDETVGANKPFKEIAHALAEKGIATIRINKRLYQKPDLMTADLTIYDEYMDDIYAAIAYAKENVSEDVFVVGHSQGAMSAPKIATDNDLKGIVMLAGTTRGLEDIVFDQSVATLQVNEGYSDKEKEKITQALQDGVTAVKELTESSTDAVLGIPARYWLSLRSLDTENILKTTLLPVLVMQGTADFQVYYEKDFKLMQSQLADRENIIFKAYDGLNHLFMPQSILGAIDTTEYTAENHIPQYVTDDIAQFILENCAEN